MWVMSKLGERRVVAAATCEGGRRDEAGEKETNATHPHVLLRIGTDKRIAHRIHLEGVKSRTRRRLERHANSANLLRAHVGELLGRDKDAVELVVADEDGPGGFPVLFV